MGIASHGGSRGGVRAAEVVAVDPVDQPGRRGSWGDQGVEVVFEQDGVDTLGAGQAVVFGQGVKITLVGQRTFDGSPGACDPGQSKA